MASFDALPALDLATADTAELPAEGGPDVLPLIVEPGAAAPTAELALPPSSGRITRSRAVLKTPALLMDDEGSATEDEDVDFAMQPSQGSRAAVTPTKKAKAPARDMAKSFTDGGFVKMVATPKLRHPCAGLLEAINANADAAENLHGMIVDLQAGVGVSGRRSGAPGEMHDKLSVLEGRVDSLAADIVATSRDAPAADGTAQTKDVDELRARVATHNAYLVKLGGSVNSLNAIIPAVMARIDSLEAEQALQKARLAMLSASDSLAPLPAIESAVPRGRVRPRSPSLEIAAAASTSARAKRARAVETPGATSSTVQLVPAISFGPWRSMQKGPIAAYNCVTNFINALPDARTLPLPYAVAQDPNVQFATAFYDTLEHRDQIVSEWDKHTPARYAEVSASPLSLPPPAPGTYANAAKAAAAGKSSR